MRQLIHIKKTAVYLAGVLLSLAAALPVSGAADTAGSLLSVRGEAQIQPIPDGSGTYLLKSDGFYCLNEKGGVHAAPAVHTFSDFSIDGSVLEGYYYHDASGKFRAGTPHMEHIAGINSRTLGEAGDVLTAFDGYYMVGNLGKLSAAPQVRYLAGLELDRQKFDGFYFFDETGKLQTEPGIHEITMTCNGKMFDGYYYFGGPNGALLSQSGLTPDGFMVDENGRVSDLDKLGIESLEKQLKALLHTYEGEWSVYVKDLETDETFTINNKELYSASLIKAFVLAGTYENLEQVRAQMAAKSKAEQADAAVVQKVDDLMWNMITISDNESFNELVRLQTETGAFKDGAQKLNEYLQKEGYEATSVQHTLAPSASPSEGLGGRNTTSVEDCGRLLEKIYKGECVSREASEAMLNLLKNQQVTWKIPQGLDSSIQTANKTGETDMDQHDIAVVYGEKTTYILCVMSEGCQEDTAIYHIRDISRMVYNYLNLYEEE